MAKAVLSLSRKHVPVNLAPCRTPQTTTSLEGRANDIDGGPNLRGDRARATGVAEELVNVLNTRRSPLSFRLQPLVLHLSEIDGPNSWAEVQGPNLFLVAKREVLLAHDQPAPTSENLSQAEETDRKVEQPAKPLATTSGAVPEGGGRGLERVAMRVVEEEELGRTGPFGIYSATTVLAGSSFTIPSDALLADVKRRREKLAWRGSAAPVATGCHDKPVVRIVLEIVENADGGAGKRTTFLTKLEKRTRGSTADEVAGSTCRVVARALLDAAFLRRMIGCQRSVPMMPSLTPTKGVNVPDEREEIGEEPSPPPFARLDVAGHVVSARPGRPQFRLQVLECQNLKSADVLGKSAPCVIAFWDGVEVGRTPIVRDDLQPVFLAASSTFHLPLAPPMTTTRSALDSQPFPEEEGGGRSRLRRIPDWQAYSPELRLEVWHMAKDIIGRKWKKGKLFGSVTLKGPREIGPVVETSVKHSSSVIAQDFVVKNAVAPGVLLRLGPDDRRFSRHGFAAPHQERASLGVVSVKIVAENSTDDSEAWLSGASLRAIIPSGKVLSSVDPSPPATAPSSSPGSGSYEKAKPQAWLEIRCLDARRVPVGCDGYCRVFWNGRQVGSTLPGSHFSRFARDPAGKGGSPPASAYQRNPVWWVSSTRTLLHVGQGRGPGSLTNSSPTAVVALGENPSAEDELTLEVFDGTHMREAHESSAVGVISKLRDSCGDSGADPDAATARRAQDGTGSGIGSASSSTARRDVLGGSLGSVTLRGKYFVNPPGGRIDLPLQGAPSSSTTGSHAAGVTLSISLARLRSDKRTEDSTSCKATTLETAPESDQHRHHDSSTSINATAAAAEPMGMGGGALEDEEGAAHHPRPTRWLRLLLEGARLRKGLDISGTSDPFCVVYVDRVWHSETRVCWGTLAPRWDQWIQVEVFGEGGALAMGLGLAGHEIRIELWDKDVVGANDFIGEAHLYLNENQDG